MLVLVYGGVWGAAELMTPCCDEVSLLVLGPSSQQQECSEGRVLVVGQSNCVHSLVLLVDVDR